MSRLGPAVVVDIAVAPASAGQRLDRFVADFAAAGVDPDLPHLSRSRLQKMIKEALVRVDGKPRRAAHILRGDERVTVVVPPPQPVSLVPEPMALEVLYEDGDLIAINKPPGLVVHPGAGQSHGTLVHGLLAHCRDLSGIGGALRPGIVHRLDRGTSGVMVVAKHDDAHRALAAQFAGRSVDKRYLAIVHGRPEPPAATIETPYGRHPKDRKRFTGIAPAGGSERRAVTLFETQVVGGGLAQLAVRIKTGRTHQIRVHLAERGHPVVADPLYGGRRINRLPAGPVRELAARLEHQALHAARLELDHPRHGERLVLEATPPAALRELMAAMAAAQEALS